MAVAYAAVLSLINTLNNASMRGFDTFVSIGSAFLLNYNKLGEDREALKSVFRAVNGEGLLANIVSLIPELDALLKSYQIEPDDCPREYFEFLSRYKFHFLSEALRNSSLVLKMKYQCFRNDCFQDWYIVVWYWLHLDDYLIYKCHIQDLKQSVCLVEAFLRDHPPVNRNDKKEIEDLAHLAEALVDNNSKSHKRVYNMQKKFERLTERKWQYDCSITSTNDFTASHSLCSSPSRRTLPLETNLVGCDDDLIKIKEHLIGFTNSLSIVSIVGMGGIGKTTLTRAVYDDPYIEHYFHIRSWIAVSQGYEVRKMLLGILSSVSNSTDELHRDRNNAQLAEQLYRRLQGRRYLIVLDDIWDIPEEVADEYLEDLISRSLLMATKRGYDGRVIKCNMHDLLRDISIRESKREEFLHVNAPQGAPCFVSRLFFHSDSGLHDEEYFSKRCSIYSFLAFGRVPPLIKFTFSLRVVDISFHPFNNFPSQILSLILLRYLALASFDDLPPSVSTLFNLQTLVRHCHEARLILPVNIWEMKQLRHLYFKKSCCLQIPEMAQCGGRHFYLPKLQTLSNLSFGSCDKEILTRIPNLKKLGLREDAGDTEVLLY